MSYVCMYVCMHAHAFLHVHLSIVRHAHAAKDLVDEDIVAGLGRRDEAEALLHVEPLNLARELGHDRLLFCTRGGKGMGVRSHAFFLKESVSEATHCSRPRCTRPHLNTQQPAVNSNLEPAYKLSHTY